ncbi:MAG: ABC transporter substrate-binding protein, partial [Promethearchaeota archaeon]
MAWDSASIDLIDQVSEGLFGYNLSDPELAIVPVLSVDLGSWNAEATAFTVTLKEGITFHDGSAFTSADVKWTFERLNNLITLGETQIAELYEPLTDGAGDPLLLIDTIDTYGDYEVIFNLNYAYVPFVPLLCFSGSVILPEGAYNTDVLMDTSTDILIGTGPYMHAGG